MTCLGALQLQLFLLLQGLSVTEYSRVLLSRYLQQGFDSLDRAKNLSIAAEELYVLLRKLRGAAGDRSDDLKAPLKAVRDAIETGPPAQAETLFLLLGRLEELLEERAAQGLEREHALGVQDILRYRLTRLVAGDAWDRKPHLKLRALKLMFGAMVRENETLMRLSSPGLGLGAGDGGTSGAPPLPELRLGRSRSFGKGRAGGGGSGGGGGGASGAGQAVPRSKWQQAIQELGKAQGSKLLPLMKLLLAENLQLSTAAEAAAGAEAEAAGAAAAPQLPAAEQGQVVQVAPSAHKVPVSNARAPAPIAAHERPAVVAAAAPTPAPATPASPQAKAKATQKAAAAPPAFNMDDLLGLNDWQEGWTQESQRTSPSPHNSLSDDPFATLVEGRGAPPRPPPTYAAPPASHGVQPSQALPADGAGARLSSMSISVPARGPSQQYMYGPPPGFAPLAATAHGTQGYGGGSIPYLPQSPHSTGAAFTPYLPQSPPTFMAAPYQAGTAPQSSPHTPEALAPAPAARQSPQYLQTGGGGAALGAGYYVGGNTPPAWGSGEGAAAGVGTQMAGAPSSVGGSSSASGSAGGTQGRAGSVEAGGGERQPHPGVFDTAFDTSSPYFGKSNPFGDGQFQELSPLQAHRPPPPPPSTQLDSQKK